MLRSALALELDEPALGLLHDAKHNLIIDGLDWAPDEWENITDDKLRTGAEVLANLVADELAEFGLGSLDEVLQLTKDNSVKFSAIALLVLGVARTMRSGIVSG